MWPRVVEFMLACWLAISPFVFRHDPDATFLWASDLACAAVVAALSLGSFWRPAHWLHLLILVVSAWLVAVGFVGGYPAPPARQNDIIVGILLLLLAVIPSYADQPPEKWRAYYRQRTA